MSLELVNTLATFGTFVVIAATAIAAIVQLRHARSNNHIAALNELRETTETPDFEAAQHSMNTELAVKLQDPAFRYQIAVPSARTDETRQLARRLNRIGNFYEGVGVLVKTGLVDGQLVLEIWCMNVIGAWNRLAQIAAIERRKAGPGLWENFRVPDGISARLDGRACQRYVPCRCAAHRTQRRVARSRQAVCRLARTGVANQSLATNAKGYVASDAATMQQPPQMH